MAFRSIPEPVPPRRGSLISRLDDHSDRDEGDSRLMKLRHNVSHSQLISDSRSEREVSKCTLYQWTGAEKNANLFFFVYFLCFDHFLAWLQVVAQSLPAKSQRPKSLQLTDGRLSLHTGSTGQGTTPLTPSPLTPKTPRTHSKEISHSMFLLSFPTFMFNSPIISSFILDF